MIITRSAPSPTGEPHIGNIRSALFAYLFAKHNNGQFLLRIEDTDRERFVPGAVEKIIASLQWLNLVPDNLNQIVVQSERLELYQKYALELVKNGKAYVCVCSKDRLAELREQQAKAQKPPMYDGHCRDSRLDLKEPKVLIADLVKNGYVVRMKMPKGRKIKLVDLIHGQVEFDSNLLDDQVILKSDGFPTYHLASVVDDHKMGITHVIRAEEWLSSTPKHIVLYEMLGWPCPEFAHLPVVLGPDKKKLSKRHGATSVMAYKTAGYLPEAMINFLALLGWNPKDEREEFSLPELVKEFKLENVNKAPAIFDSVKLDDINEKYLREMVGDEGQGIGELLVGFGLSKVSSGERELLARGGFKTVKAMADCILALRQEPNYDSQLLMFKKSNQEKTLQGLKLALASLQSVADNDWQAQKLQPMLELVVKQNNLTNGDVFWPVRVALSGQEKSPSPVELLVALGRTVSLQRLEAAIKKL